MTRRLATFGLILGVVGCLVGTERYWDLFAAERDAADSKGADRPSPDDLPSTVEEARGRARLLHETMHGTLQYVHREYFREDERLKIPAATMKNVFRDVATTQGVKMRWMAVNARAMSVDHEPQNDFERAAAAAISAGKEFHDATRDQTYFYAGAITLHAECLGCHLPARSSNKARSAAIVISVPLRPKATSDPAR